MALTVTVAGASSDSYATLVEAGTFLDWKSNDLWDNASDATKEGALKAAVRLMDLLPYRGRVSATTQALRFPSSDMTDSNGDLYIPDEIKEAQCLLGLALLEDPDLDAGPAGGFGSVSVTGSFSVTSKGDSETLGGLPQNVLRRLNPWLLTHGPNELRVWNSAGRSFE